MDLRQVYTEPCPNCDADCEPEDMVRVDGGHIVVYFCTVCQGASWELAFWANPRHDDPSEL